MSLSTSKIRLSLLLQLLCLAAGFVSPVFALDFNAYWLYRQAGGEGQETRREFQQRYSLGVGQTLTYQPTSAITVSGGLGYARTQRDQGQGRGLETTDELTPFGQVSLVNDIFVAQLSGTKSLDGFSSQTDDTTSSWDATLGSAWQIPLWPSLQFNYGERTESTADSSLKTKSKGMTLNWDLQLATLHYQYQNSEDEDQDSGDLTETDSHFARFETAGGFWNRRITFNLAQQFQRSTSTMDKLIGQVLALVTDPITGPDPEDVVLEGAPRLADDDQQTVALTVPADLRLQLGFSFDLPQDIGTLRLFLDPLQVLTDAQVAALHWDLYVRNPFDTGWDLAAADIPAFYTATESRFDLPINRFAREIMVVAVNNAGVTLLLTELEAGRTLSETIRTQSTDYLTNFSLSARLTRTLQAYTSLTLDHFDSETGDTSLTYIQRNMTGRLRWSPVPYLVPSIGFSENRVDQTGEADQINRAYSLIVSTIPLPTMNVTFGATRSERFSGTQKTDTTDQYSVYTKAQIYPDLTANLTLTQRYNDTLDSDAQFVRTSSFSSRLILTARLFEPLTAELTSDYNNRDREGEEKSETASERLNLLYRPSDLLALTGSYTTFLLDSENSDILLATMDLALLRTNKARFNLIYSFRQADNTLNSFALTGSWDISHNLALQTQANYTISEVSIYNFFASMSLRL